MKNSRIKRFDKLWTFDPPVCAAPTDVLNSTRSGLVGWSKLVTPLNPRIHPVNEVVPIPVYVMISSSIFNNPYLLGYPFVESTKIVEEYDSVLVDNPVYSVSAAPTNVCNLVYLSRFSAMLIDPP